MNSFDWQTEDDGWNERSAVDEPFVRTKKRWWPMLLLAVIIVAGIAFLIYRQVQQRIDAAVARTENDIRRTHELVLQAADRSDRDLLNNLISSRDETWLNKELDVAEEGALFNPRAFGLVLQQDSTPQLDFELSADLSEAEVYTTRTFTVQSSKGVSETVFLKQYAIYRRSQDRWLFSPPQNLVAFWGDSKTEEGRFLTINYPERDAEAVHPLFRYLDAKLAEMCTDLPDFSCPNNLRIYLKLETDPTGQLGLTDWENAFQHDPDLTLPTLTLVGIPVDEAAQAALYRGYAAFVVRTAMIQALNWDCCVRGVFFEALVDYQLAELGISPYPMYPTDYETLFSRFQEINDLDLFWNRRQVELSRIDDWQWVYALVDFALTSSLSQTTAGEMQTSLLDSDSFLNWINDALAGTLNQRSVRQAWLNFIYYNSLSGQVASGTFTPPEDVLLACNNEGSTGTDLYRYDWNTETWQTEDRLDEPVLIMVSTEDDSGMIVQAGFSEDDLFTVLWRNGEETPLLDRNQLEGDSYYFFGWMSPNRRWLLLAQNSEDFGVSVLDLNSCDGSGCQVTPLPGLPQWSPDSSQMLIQYINTSGNADNFAELSRVDSAGQIISLSGSGTSPFWFSNEEYGYISYGIHSEVYGALTADDQPQLLLSKEDLLQMIPEEERPKSLNFLEVLPNPATPNILAIIASFQSPQANDNYIYYWNRPTGELALVGTLNEIYIGSAEWLPNGEWLSVMTADPLSLVSDSSLPWSYYLYHGSGEGQPIVVGREAEYTYLSLDHTLDGNWVVVPRENYVEVVGLEHMVSDNQPYRRLLSYNFTNCRNAAFISSRS
ncbi:MAG: hypothetical protein WAM60_13195 [Candidatus Promineifilaceae bacterium]